MRVEEIPLKGEHNVENVLAACTAASLAGADAASIANGVKTFQGVEHRLEFVAEMNGVAFYNDSKATNVDATVKAIESFPGSLIVILGGKDKGTGYAELREPLRQRARLVLLIGAAAEKIAAQLEGAVPIEHAGTIGRAVELAAESREARRCCAARAGVRQFRSVRKLRASRPRFQGACGAARARIGRRHSPYGGCGNPSRERCQRCHVICSRTGNCLA